MKVKKCYEIYARESGTPCYMERLIWATDDKAEAERVLTMQYEKNKRARIFERDIPANCEIEYSEINDTYYEH